VEQARDLAQRTLLARAVDDLTRDAPREPPARDLEPVRPHVLDPERGSERLDDLREAARDEPERPPARLELGHELACTGGELDLGADLVEHRDREPCEGRDALVERGREVDLAAHRALGDLRDALTGSCPLGEELDDLGRDERRVDVRHDQTYGTGVLRRTHTRRLAAHAHPRPTRPPLGPRHPDAPRGRTPKPPPKPSPLMWNVPVICGPFPSNAERPGPEVERRCSPTRPSGTIVRQNVPHDVGCECPE